MQAQELEDLKCLVTADVGVRPTVGPNMDQLSPTVPSAPTVLVEWITTVLIGCSKWGGSYVGAISARGRSRDSRCRGQCLTHCGSWQGQACGQHSVHIQKKHNTSPPPSTVQSDHGGVVVGEVDTPTAEDVEPHYST